jgi:hypothetical protein
MLNPIELTLDLDTVEYLLSYLDDEPQDTVINEIREEIFHQTYL